MIRLLAISALLIVAGCGEECPPSFEPGDYVKHRLSGERGVVLSEPLDIRNYQGTCLVRVRFKEKDTESRYYSIYEVERIDG